MHCRPRSMVRTTSLQLNANKTEMLLVGLRHNLTKPADEDLSLTIGLETVGCNLPMLSATCVSGWTLLSCRWAACH